MEQSKASGKMRIAARVSAWWIGLRPPIARWYLIATGCLLIGLAIFSLNPELQPIHAASRMSFVLFALVFLWEAYIWLLPKLELPLVKLAIAAAGVMAAAAATGVSRMAVNEATGQDPTYFGTTVALLVPISFVPVLAALVLVGGMLVVPVTMLGSFLTAVTRKSKHADLDIFLSMARMFACIVVIASAASLLTTSSFLFPMMRWLASYGAYAFDFQADPVCAPADNDRVLRINDNLIIVGRLTDDGFQFVRQECPLTAEIIPLRPQKSSPQSKPSQIQ